MSISPQQLTALYTSFLANRCSPEELERLIAELGANPGDFSEELVMHLFDKTWEHAVPMPETHSLPPISVPAERPVVRHLPLLRYAAILLLFAGIAAAVYLYIIPPFKKHTEMTRTQHPPDIPPGSSKAILTLADGTTILLDSAAEGQLARENGVKVLKLNNGSLAYQGNAVHEGLLYNTLRTPKGGQYQVTLPDGTRVWLNAASSIHFPTAFARDRTVEITGETYFEVATDKNKPFFVKTGNATIQVLGTSFNINSYADETSIEATLLEGSIKVSDTSPAQPLLESSVILQSGQQAQITPGTKTIIVNNKPDLEQTLAWKNGLFNFNGSGLQQVMRQLERWYDIRVEYEGPVSKDVFEGEMYRNVNLSDVLKALQRMDVKFRREGKTLIVTSS